MTKLSRKKGGGQTKSSKTSYGFTNQPIFKSPFSSQRNKMKRKASSRRFVPAVFFSSTQKSREILELQKQLHVMQQKIRSIEDTQRSIQAASVNPHATDSEQSKSMGEDSKKVRTFEDEVSQPSTSRKSNGKRKRRRDASDEDPLGTVLLIICSIF